MYLMASDQQKCEQKQKIALMLHSLGSEILPIYKSWIRGRLICRLTDNKIKEKLLKEGYIELEKVLDVCRSDEIVRK